jgi:hypothetical protein
VSDDDERARPLFGFDPDAAARLVAEVQDLGFNAARMVVDRFAEMFDHYRAEAGSDTTNGGERGPKAEPGVHFCVDDGAYRRLQSDVQRALEMYLDVLRRFSEVSLPFFDGARSWGATSAEAEGLVLPDVARGGRCSARMWLRNPTGSAATNLRLWTPGLFTHTGDALAAEVVTFSPSTIQRLDPAESAEILAVVSVANDAVVGSYHGHVRVEGLADTAFPLIVRVVPEPSAP